MLADHHGRIRVLERRASGEEVKCGGGQRILIGPAVQRHAHQLFGGGVRHRPDRHVGRGQAAGIVDPAGDPEVSQHDSLIRCVGVGDQHVRGLDVPVQQPALMGVVQCRRHGGDELGDLRARHAVGMTLAQQVRGVGAVDVVHGDPQLTVVLAAVVHPDDVGMPQRGGHVGLAFEPLAVLAVGRHLGEQNLQRVLPGESWVLRQVHLAHAAGTQSPHDPVAGERRPLGQRHARDSSRLGPVRGRGPGGRRPRRATRRSASPLPPVPAP